jgi:hypothetical protein
MHEYKAKGCSVKEIKDIIDVPPHEYQECLVSVLDSYFMARPCAHAPGGVLPRLGLIEALFPIKGPNWLMKQR